jgi:hypothetical protein
MPAKPTPPPTQAFNDVLARMMQAEVNEGGRPPATPCDTPAEVLSRIPMTDPRSASPRNEETVQTAKQEFEKTLTEQLARLREEIHEIHTKSATLKQAAITKWSETTADLEAKQQAAREWLGEITKSTGTAWEHLRDGAQIAWNELEKAVRKARSEF